MEVGVGVSVGVGVAVGGGVAVTIGAGVGVGASSLEHPTAPITSERINSDAKRIPNLFIVPPSRLDEF